MTALRLVTTLHQIAEGCTIICSIHQPQGKIFALFDSLLLLKGGEIAYHGPTKDALPYFEQTGAVSFENHEQIATQPCASRMLYTLHCCGPALIELGCRSQS